MSATAVSLLQGYSLSTTKVSTTINGMVGSVWAGTVLDLSSGTASRWGSAAAPLIEAARFESAVNTGSYMNLALQELFKRPPLRRPEEIDIRHLVSDLRNGPTTEELLHRPIAEARSLVKAGMPTDEAIRRGGRRAQNLVATDMQLAKTHMAQEMLSAETELWGYRRVLNGSESCGLCVVASTQRYHIEELMPIHPACDCGIAPILATEDPGRVINRPLLESAHDAIEERFGPGAVDRSARNAVYRPGTDPKGLNVRLETYEHGEYGPTLARVNDHHLQSGAASARPKPKTLGGYTAFDVEERTGRKLPRPDWAEKLGVEPGEAFEVSTGPYDPTINSNGGIPGPGVARVTDDNRLFYVEYPPEMEGANPELRKNATIRTRLDKLERADDLAGFDRYRPTVSMSVQGVSRDEISMNSRAKRQTRVKASAGAGRVVHFHGEVSEQTHWHETGHVVANEINRTAERTGALGMGYRAAPNSNAPGSNWSKAMEADAKHRRSLIDQWSDFDGSSSESSQYPTLEFGSKTKLGQDFYGVTEYGSTNVTEDFAESWRLATQSAETGSVAIQRGSDGEIHQVPFEEMYPNRWAYFEDIQRQLSTPLPFMV